jgi:hypothetical protein
VEIGLSPLRLGDDVFAGRDTPSCWSLGIANNSAPNLSSSASPTSPGASLAVGVLASARETLGLAPSELPPHAAIPIAPTAIKAHDPLRRAWIHRPILAVGGSTTVMLDGSCIPVAG